jgi:hypothetical protein
MDILMDPVTTATLTLTPNVQCIDGNVDSKTCVGSTNAGMTCATDGECPGGMCRDQCFCAAQRRPNWCDPACVGGMSDAAPCSVDADCPGGFCHAADCRENAGDPDGPDEGVCSIGSDGHCSTHDFLNCGTDSNCRPPGCSFCDVDETCVVESRQCFPNGGIVRTGAPHPTDPVHVALFCHPPTSSASTDTLLGLPGPAAIRQPVTTTLAGFP